MMLKGGGDLDYESVFDMNYLSNCFSETMRSYPVATTSSLMEILSDTSLGGKLQVQKNDIVAVDIYGLHNNPKEWREPEKFIPDRFDPESDYYLTAAGRKRHSASYMPFLSGQRSCFGKTYAEVAVRTVTSILIYHFDWTVEDDDFKCYTPGY